MKSLPIQQILQIAGLAQIALAAGSMFIPKILNWKGELATVRTLIKQMFWTYAAYILIINLCFGLSSVFASRDLVNGSGLAAMVTGFIAIYWISRVFIQFLYFDRGSFPEGLWPKIGEIVLVTLFIFLSLVYSVAFYINLLHR